MNPIVHGELAWLLGQGLSTRRDRLLVTFAGLAPDLDGISILGGSEAFSHYHHKAGHGLVAAILVSLVLLRFAKQRQACILWGLAAFHLHVLCDLVGDGPYWAISYWWPLSNQEWHWDGAWAFVSWQNSTIGMLATLGCLATALVWERTIVEVISVHWDNALTATLRQRFLGRE